MPLSWKRRRLLIQRACRVWARNGPNTEVDFVGMAEYGVCSSKALKYFGLKLHSVVSLTGVVMGFVLTGASHYDNQAVVEARNYERATVEGLHMRQFLGYSRCSGILFTRVILDDHL